MPATVLRANATDLPLADESVDLIVTSPPYFALRSYQDGGEHYPGQLGSEPTPAEFVAALLAVTRECVRVLKPSGSAFVNLGDKYSGDKSLLGIPWRYAIACIDELGLILRAEVIWAKPNGLPESVTDRVRRSHETWFHFVRQPRYYSAVDEIREAHSEVSIKRAMPHRANPGRRPTDIYAGQNGQTLDLGQMNHPLGKLPGSVWTIPTQPLTVPAHLGVDHFAAFPMEWPRRIIRGWSPPGICTACGEGRRPVVDKALEIRQRHLSDRQDRNGDNQWGTSWRDLGGATRATITGYACACPDTTAPTRPSVILDPFGGTGTVALVAHALGRHAISVDLSADYCRLAKWRTTDRGEYARALQVDKPAVQIDGQGSLLDLLEEGA